MHIPPWAAGYVGTPYDQADCWELTRRVLAEQFDAHLPASPEIVVEARSRYATEVEAPELGDVVLMTRLGRPHVGVLVAPGVMLHTTSGKNAVAERIVPYRHRVVGYFRVVRARVPVKLG